MARVVPNPLEEPTVSVERAAALMGISRNLAYEAVRAGRIPAIRLGERKLVVPTGPLLHLLGLSVSDGSAA